MRRMMHAITVPLLFSSVAFAQDFPDAGVHSAPAITVAPAVEAIPANPAPEYYPTSSGQPYSALSSFMTCHDNCKDFWAGYSAERAAIAARLCKECNHRHCHSCQSCVTGGCHTGCGVGGCDSQSCDSAGHGSIANRYQQSWSTVYGASEATRGAATGVAGALVNNGRRDQNPHMNNGANSLLVPSQGNAQARGNAPAAGWAAYPQTSGQPGNQPVISPYLKARNASQDSVSKNGWRQGGPQKDGPMYMQATVPPTSGSWAR